MFKTKQEVQEELVRIAAKRNREAIEKLLGKKCTDDAPTNPFVQYAQPTKK
jgi:hypothetical protein